VVFVGLKMTLADVYEMPVHVSLLLIVLALAAAVVCRRAPACAGATARERRPRARRPASRPRTGTAQAGSEGGTTVTFRLRVMLTAIGILFLPTTLALATSGVLRHPARAVTSLAALLALGLALIAE
jgi:hypothetical protein